MSYPIETLSEDEDWGLMPKNVEKIAEAVVGHKIISAEVREVTRRWGGPTAALKLTLDNGKEVHVADTDDCCAYTALEGFLLDPASVDHIITGVGTTEGYTVWHIYADWGDILQLDVGWSCGNPFYYGYGFDITVVDPEEDKT